jgi:alginate O-acetyltransferase complex protein AlgJ
MRRSIKPSTYSKEDSRAAGRAERLQGAIMVAVLAIGFWQGVAAMVTPAAQRLIADTLTIRSVLSGRTAAAVNDVMAHRLPIDDVLRAAGGVIRYRVFHSGGPAVWVGRGDWLYLMEELRPWADPETALVARADIAQQVGAALRKRGICLLMALVPDKARVEQATLGDAPRARQTVTRYASFVRLLRERGVSVVDLNATLTSGRQAGPVYYRTDTHWNQPGAALGAGAIATAVAAPITRSYVYRSHADAAETDGPGDLLRLMSLDKVPDIPLPALRPHPDRQHLEHTVQFEAPATAGGLLEDTKATEVALLGSSFSLNANFAGRLQEALGAPVANFAKAGGGFSSAMQSYFGSLAYRETPPKLVIWEVPERVIEQPLNDADRALQDMVEGNVPMENSTRNGRPPVQGCR